VLVELRLENYAVVDNLAVEFAPGLNLLTGETGAGKSILIDALALLLGDKASADVIRSGADKATISAVFEVESGEVEGGAVESGKKTTVARFVGEILENNGIDQEDDSVILRREIAAGGKGRVFVNNQPATVIFKSRRPRKRFPSGKVYKLASRSSSAMSRIVCACSTCGRFRRGKLKMPNCRLEKTNGSKPKSVSSPTRRRSTVQP